MARISNVISNLSVNVGAGGTFTIRPPAGEAWLVKDFTSNNAPVANVADISVSLTDGANPCLSMNDPTTDPGKRLNQCEYYITHDLFLLITNTGAAGAEIGWFGEKVNPNTVVGEVLTLGAGATVSIIPPVGQTWKITDYGCDVWTAGPADINPDVSIQITDGALILSNLIDPTMARGQDKQRNWYIDAANYLNVLDTGGGGSHFAYCGTRIAEICIGAIQDIIGSATYDIRPPAGEEWLISEFSAETWVGAAPAGYPDITVSLMVAADLSDLLTGAGANLRWDEKLELNIDHDHWIRITETSAANNETGFLGIVKRQYDN